MSLSSPSTTYYFLSDDFKPNNSEIEFGEKGFSYNSEHIHFENTLPLLHEEGWEKVQLVDGDIFSDLKEKVSNYIQSKAKTYQPINKEFVLEDYHKHVKNDEIHYAISTWALSTNVIEPFYSSIKEKMQDILACKLDSKEIIHNGTKGKFMGFRIVRPEKQDHNPYHRDAWLPYWRNTLNIWIPICGFEPTNTLSLIPKSHIIDDSDIVKTKIGANINGKKYHVPAAVALKTDFETIRPKLIKGEGLLFSPYLLHGNGINILKDTTRVSIELRLSAI